ncbi:DNA helicase IV [bioreactor metagenome]|uniref:DNA helicase IV n=1 Tax=bioreactor metagenome TaxID=1076179 RepID=A0A645FY20_9ZZZZ
MEYANKFLKEDKIVPIVRSGKKVIEKNFPSHKALVEEIYSNLQTLTKEGFESIAIVCKNLQETEKISASIKSRTKLKVIDREDIIYNKGEVALPSYFAKGLEFDAVIVVKSQEDAEEDKMAYVMATRALHELYVYNV